MKAMLFLLPCLLACTGPPTMQPVMDKEGHLRAEVGRVDGRKEGVVRFFTKDGTPTTKGTYKNDSRDGMWTTLGTKGNTLSIVQFDRGRKNGLQAYWTPGGKLLRLERFKEGSPNGELYRFFADGSPRQITWYAMGIPEGPYLEWYKVDQTSIAFTMGQFHRGERDGTWTWFYGNGKPSARGQYASGKKTGTWLTWAPNGKLLGLTELGAP